MRLCPYGSFTQYISVQIIEKPLIWSIFIYLFNVKETKLKAHSLASHELVMASHGDSKKKHDHLDYSHSRHKTRQALQDFGQNK